MKKEHYIIFGLLMIIVVGSVVFYYEMQDKAIVVERSPPNEKPIIPPDTKQAQLEYESRVEGRTNREKARPKNFITVTCKEADQGRFNVKRISGFVKSSAEYVPYCKVLIGVKYYDANNEPIPGQQLSLETSIAPKSETPYEFAIRPPRNVYTFEIEVVEVFLCEAYTEPTVTF